MRYTCNVTDDPYNAKIKRETRKIMEEDLRLFFFFYRNRPEFPLSSNQINISEDYSAIQFLPIFRIRLIIFKSRENK